MKWYAQLAYDYALCLLAWAMLAGIGYLGAPR
jgi:hypothetical protein